jgi:hypothetical protein
MGERWQPIEAYGIIGDCRTAARETIFESRQGAVRLIDLIPVIDGIEKGAPRQHTFSKVMCWLALDRLLKLEEQHILSLGSLAERATGDCRSNRRARVQFTYSKLCQ